MSYRLQLFDVADEDVRSKIIAPLVAYNESKAGPSSFRPLVVTLITGEMVAGGLWGYTSYGWLFTQLLVVPASLRGVGIGRQLMELAETEAIARGCHSAWLDTHEFQARAFYEKIGYVSFGQLSDYPLGFSRTFLQKRLAPGKNAT